MNSPETKTLTQEQVQQELATAMEVIQQRFGASAVITLVVRPTAGTPSGVIASNDPDLEVVREMLLNYRRHLSSANRTNGK